MTDFISRLEQVRAGYNEERTRHRFLLDAYTGGGGFQGRFQDPLNNLWGAASSIYHTALTTSTSYRNQAYTTETYLDRFPRESDERFQARCESSVYWNYVAPLTDLNLSYIFRKEFAALNRPDPVAEWRNDVDGKGQTFNEFKPLCALRAFVLGYCPTVVDLPLAPRDDEGNVLELTRAIARDSGSQPRVVPLFPANILDWECDEGGGFTWLKHRTDHIFRQDPFSDPQAFSRFTIWYQDRVQVFEVWQQSGNRIHREITPPEGAPHPFGEVPVAILRNKPAPDDPILGIPMYGEVANANRDLFNKLSERSDYFRSAVFAILVLACREDAGEPVLGSGNGLTIDPDQAREHYYLSPDGSVGSQFRDLINDIITEIYRQARVEYTTGSKASVSGESKRFTFQQQNRLLSDFAGQIAKWEEHIDLLVGRALGVGEEALMEHTVVPPKDFDIEDMQLELQLTMDAISLNLGDTAETMLRGKVTEQLLPNLSDDDKASILSEQEAIPAEQAAQAALAATVLQDGEDGEDDEAA